MTGTVHIGVSAIRSADVAWRKAQWFSPAVTSRSQRCKAATLPCADSHDLSGPALVLKFRRDEIVSCYGRAPMTSANIRTRRDGPCEDPSVIRDLVYLWL